jgi:hypothetical protein
VSDPLLLLLSWLLCLVTGVEIGGRWAAWVAREAVRRAGAEREFELALDQLKDPRNWRKR